MFQPYRIDTTGWCVRFVLGAVLMTLVSCADDVDPWALAFEPCEDLMQREADAHVDDLLVSKIYDRLDFTSLAPLFAEEALERHVVPHPIDPNGLSTIVLLQDGATSFSYLDVNEKILAQCVHIGLTGSPIAVQDIFAPGAAQDIVLRGPVFSSLEGFLLVEVGVKNGEFESLTLVSTYID